MIEIAYTSVISALATVIGGRYDFENGEWKVGTTHPGLANKLQKI